MPLFPKQQNIDSVRFQLRDASVFNEDRLTQKQKGASITHPQSSVIPSWKDNRVLLRVHNVLSVCVHVWYYEQSFMLCRAFLVF